MASVHKCDQQAGLFTFGAPALRCSPPASFMHFCGDSRPGPAARTHTHMRLGPAMDTNSVRVSIPDGGTTTFRLPGAERPRGPTPSFTQGETESQGRQVAVS